jgi:hypothetical protein
MKKQHHINIVLDMVEAFLGGKMSRTEFTLDFPYEVQQRYSKMAREDEEFARLINDRLVEEGIYEGEHLGDEAFKNFMKKLYLDVVDISGEGFL